MNRASFFIPLAVFAVIAVFLWRGFSLEDPHSLPSALIGKPFPEFDLATVRDPNRRVTRADLPGQAMLVNVWGTWCPQCRFEHDDLMTIATLPEIAVVGVNYKDNQERAREWLRDLGDPYLFSIADREGRLAIELGVYGAPETFLVDADGVIRYKRIGVVDDRIWRTEIVPALAELGIEVPADLLAAGPQTASLGASR